MKSPCSAICCAAFALLLSACRPAPGPDAVAVPDADAAGTPAAERHVVVVHRPAGAPRVALGLFDDAGDPITVSCSACHAATASDPSVNSSDQLDRFHQGLVFVHGTLACAACHGGNAYDTLRLADGRALPFEDVMTLCRQCHGPQGRDYDHGAHGGMTGYWDLTRGPRSRNGCTDCHDPHAPAFPRMQPKFKPHDRFLTPEEGHDHAE